MLFHGKFCAAAALAVVWLTTLSCHLPADEERQTPAETATANEASPGQTDDGPPPVPDFRPGPTLLNEEAPSDAEHDDLQIGRAADNHDDFLPFRRHAVRRRNGARVRPAEWEQFQVERDADELHSPLWAPPVPRQRPTVRGRWVWLPDPSEIRGNGLFSPDAVCSPCDIGPRDAIEETAERPVHDFRLHCECQPRCECALRCECPKCGDSKQRSSSAAGCRCPGRGAACEPPTNREIAEVAELMSRRPSVVEGSLFQGEDVDCPGHGHLACEDCRRQSALQRLQQIEADVEHLNPDEWVEEPRALNQQNTTEQRVADSIRVLRETSFDLEVAAQRLEEQQLYYRADQLREFANQLRQEGRSALGGWSLKRLQQHAQESPVDAERDLGLELEQLRDELHRVREALRISNEATRR